MCETSSCHLKAPCSIHGVDSAVSTQTFCFSFSLLTPRPFAFCSFIPVSTLSYISYKRFAPLPRPCCPVLVHTNHSSQPTSVLCFGPHWFVFTVLFEHDQFRTNHSRAGCVVGYGHNHPFIHSSIHPSIHPSIRQSNHRVVRMMVSRRVCFTPCGGSNDPPDYNEQ